jgi:hypothetical protein
MQFATSSLCGPNKVRNTINGNMVKFVVINIQQTFDNNWLMVVLFWGSIPNFSYMIMTTRRPLPMISTAAVIATQLATKTG